MTRRGRWTIAGLGLLVAALVWWAAAPERPPQAAPGAAVSFFGGGSPAAGSPLAPEALLAHLPPDPSRLARVERATASLELPGPLLAERVAVPPDRADLEGPLEIEYAFDADLTEIVERVLARGRVKRGHAIVLDTETGRVLAYVSTDPGSFPADQTYPAASLVKVVTAAAALHQDPELADRPCHYAGNPYRLRRTQIDPPKRGGLEVSLTRALGMSNNQCFAQIAVHEVGARALIDAIRRFGWLEEPAPGHPAGQADAGEDRFDVGRLGCGLAGCRITPLHAAQLAASLADGRRVEPWWIHRIRDAQGRELVLPEPRPWRRVMTRDLAARLREMLVYTTTRGTARSAFRDRRGRPRLGPVQVAGKTGNLSGEVAEGGDDGRFEWFAGVAPADHPAIAVAVVQMHDALWWQHSAAIAAGIFEGVFCERGRCTPERAARFTGAVDAAVTPILLSDAP